MAPLITWAPVVSVSVFRSRETRLAAGLIVVCMVVFGLGYLAVSKQHGPSGSQRAPTTLPFYQGITDFSYQIYGPNGLVTRLQADTLAIVPRRFLVFNIRSINEVHVANVHLETYLYEEEAPDTEPVTAVTGLLEPIGIGVGKRRSRDEFGLITRSLVSGIVMKVFRKDSLAVVIRAEHAVIKSEGGKPRFLKASLEDAESTRRILADKIIWDEKDRVFMIPGHYVAHTPRGRASGRGIRIDLDFVVTSL